MVENPIESTSKWSDLLLVEYGTYQNAANKNVFNATLALYWRYRILTLAFGANIYDRLTMGNDAHSELFYNFQLTGVLRFEHDWTLSGQVVAYLPDCDFYIRTSLEKAWGPWSLRLMFDNLTCNNVSAGFTYKF